MVADNQNVVDMIIKYCREDDHFNHFLDGRNHHFTPNGKFIVEGCIRSFFTNQKAAYKMSSETPQIIQERLMLKRVKERKSRVTWINYE